jgi:DNA adenine methylase
MQVASEESSSPAHPFLKWAGSKRQLLPELRKRVYRDFSHYWEPFAGGAALFFDIASSDPRVWEHNAAEHKPWATLSDSNKWLVDTYRAIRDNVRGVISYLKEYEAEYRRRGAEFYYEVRKRSPVLPADQAAAFVFLNKTGFNGLFRVNKTGGFNVPHGKRSSPPLICDAENLYAVANVLQHVDIQSGDFTWLGQQVQADDLVYFDPPYWPASASADFTAYVKEPFGPAEQEVLRDLALSLKKRGAAVLLSNADVPPIRALYKDFTIERVEARRNINSNGSDRGSVGEVIIS